MTIQTTYTHARARLAIALRIFQLVEAIMRDPFQGIGSGVWSRRITQEHRLVYVFVHERVDFVQARYHY